MNPVTIASFNTEAAANPVKDRLRAHGIPAEVSNQRLFQRVWFLAKPYAAHHLTVPKESQSRADELLARWQTEEGALSEALHCPQCGSLRIEYPQMTRKFVMPTLIAHSLSLVGALRHEFYCIECQHTWPWPTKTGDRPLKTSLH